MASSRRFSWRATFLQLLSQYRWLVFSCLKGVPQDLQGLYPWGACEFMRSLGPKPPKIPNRSYLFCSKHSSWTVQVAHMFFASITFWRFTGSGSSRSKKNTLVFIPAHFAEDCQFDIGTPKCDK